MEITNLKSSLEKQIYNLKNLYETGQKKQKALIGRNNDLLVECMQDEEKFLFYINEEEKKRLTLMENIYNEENINEKQPKLEILIEHLKGKLSEEDVKFIESAKEIITKLSKSIADQNFKNLYLIEQARSFISQTINILKSTNKRSMLDRKI